MDTSVTHGNKTGMEEISQEQNSLMLAHTRAHTQKLKVALAETES